MNPTRLIYKLAFERRYKQLERYATHAHELQQEQLAWLVNCAQGTDFGQQHGFASMLRKEGNVLKADYRIFSEKVPLSNYAATRQAFAFTIPATAKKANGR